MDPYGLVCKAGVWYLVAVVARVRRERLDMFRRTLLSFGGDVEVVSPPAVRADLAGAAAEVIARYG